MAVDYSKIDKASSIICFLNEEIIEACVKGRFAVYYDKLQKHQWPDILDPVIEDSFVREFVQDYYNSRDFYCNVYVLQETVHVNWDYGEEGTKAKYYFDLTTSAIDLINDYKVLMTSKLLDAAQDHVPQWEVAIDKEFYKDRTDTISWLVDETKKYCDEHDDFFNCEIKRVNGDMVLVFS